MLFPLLYLTLELPKRIVNDAIGASSDTVEVAGFQFEQVTFLGLLCIAFLIAVIAHGLLKMRINTMKGVLAERMLRRLRYDLICRILRFPKPYFQRTSQGELVSMVTSESEPMGGIMGDAFTQPVLQAGQMITILMFLFLQSFWFGLAAIALIPLQAWLIPRMQKRINLLNKARVQQVRKLASEIGESASGATTLRGNGGLRRRKAIISARLGRLFEIRFQVYQKKFFMKFVNNLITQLTPLLFFSIGGYLVIQGNITIGALVAALAAYKDLSSPWKELLTYYNQVQEMSMRWEIITQRFAPAGIIDAALIDGEPADSPSLSSEVTLTDVSVHDEDGVQVLKDVTLHFPAGSSVAITAPDEEDRSALAEVLTRETLPSQGCVTLGGQNLSTLHQSSIAKAIGYANSRPYVFAGSFGDNIMMPLQTNPQAELDKVHLNEAVKSGNSLDMIKGSWIDPALIQLTTQDQVRDWWLDLIEGIGGGEVFFRRGLDLTFSRDDHPDLAARLVALRPVVADRIAQEGLQDQYFRFDQDRYNPAIPVTGNLLFAARRQDITQEQLAAQTGFVTLLRQLKLDDDMLNLSLDVIDMLRRTFGTDGTDHPMFRKLGLNPETYLKTTLLAEDSRHPGFAERRPDDFALLLTVPFQVSAEQIGPAFSDEVKNRIVKLRHAYAARVLAGLEHLFEPLDETRFTPNMTVLENALFGKMSQSAGSAAERIRALVSDVLHDNGLTRPVIDLIYDLPTDLGGTNLPAVFSEALSVSRAVIKRPGIVVMDRALTSYDTDTRRALNSSLRKALPEATLIYLDDQFDPADRFDVTCELRNGKIVQAEDTETETSDSPAGADLAQKVRALQSTDLFADLDRRQLRLLAFGARWYSAPQGTTIFHKRDAAHDGAYLVLEGEAGLYDPDNGDGGTLIMTATPGTIVGELGLIRNEPRKLDMRVHSDLRALRIGAEEFLSVVENDAATAFKLLQVVAGYLAQPVVGSDPE